MPFSSFGRFFAVVIIAMSAVLPLRAQLSEDIVPDMSVVALFPARVSDWSAAAEQVQLTLTNRTQDVINAKIDVQLLVGDTIFARGRLFTMPLLQIIPGINQYDATQLFSSLEFELYRNIETQLRPNTVLPAGPYLLCLRVITEDGSRPLSQPICRQITIHGQIMPVLLRPERLVSIGGQYDATLEFRWELPYGVQAPPGEWLLRVVEANTGDADSIALLTGPVILERIVRDSTTFQITNPGTFFNAETRYLWSVRAMPESVNLRNTGQRVMPQTGESDPAERWAVPLSFTVSGRREE